MTTRPIAIITLAGALAIGCGAAAVGSPGETGRAPSAAASPAASGDGAASLAPEAKHEAGAVTVIASWIPDTASARVALDTHSVDLDGFDLRQLARVRLDGGSWVTPTGWDAPKGGHHRSGTLTFGSLGPRAIASARVIELEVRDVGATHLLRWDLAR